MSKTRPGHWEPPSGKPEEFTITGSGSALDRIAASTPDAAYEVAAQRAANAGLEYGTSGVVPNTPEPSQRGATSLQARTQTASANFDNIQDDYNYQIATSLYKAGSPDESLQLPDGTQAELYSEDMAIMFITAGRTMDHVDLQTYRSVRGLDAAWDELLREAGY